MNPCEWEERRERKFKTPSYELLRVKNNQLASLISFSNEYHYLLMVDSLTTQETIRLPATD